MTAPQHKPFTAYFPLTKKKLPSAGWRKTQPREDNPWPLRHGINLQPGELIIDVDPLRYPEDEYGNVINSLTQLRKDFALPETRLVRTPSGGVHIYYTFPQAHTIRHRQQPYPGIDFLTEGRQFLGAGTMTEDGVYILEQDLPIAVAPLDMILCLEPKPPAHKRLPWDLVMEDDAPEDIDRFESFLYRTPPAISKQHGNDRTYVVACYGRDFGLSQDRVLECMDAKFNIKCLPPWSESELYTIVDSAFRTAKGKAGSRAVSSDPELAAIAATTAPTKLKNNPLKAVPDAASKGKEIADLRFSHLHRKWIDDKNGAHIRNNRVNARIYLEEEVRFKDLFFWDEFSNEAKFSRAPSWAPDKQIPSGVNDDDVRQILDWFSGMEYQVSSELAWFAVEQLAFLKTRHPVKDYLNAVVWDGVPRLDRIMIDTCGSPDTEYNRLVGKNTLIAGVARIYQPGTLVKNVLILKGVTNLRKSMWIDILAAPWGAVGCINPGDKDTYMNLAGNWIVELPEINQTLGKRDVNAVKAIVSTREDTYRAPYEHKSRKVGRQSIFIGSINPTATGFLVDETGDSRYWPVEISGCNIELLAETKDQLWAEAFARYHKAAPGQEVHPNGKGGEIWWLTAEQEKLAEIEQMKNKKFDPWTSMIGASLGDKTEVETFTAFQWVSMSMDRVRSSDYDRLGAVMAYFGFRLDRLTWKKTDIDTE